MFYSGYSCQSLCYVTNWRFLLESKLITGLLAFVTENLLTLVLSAQSVYQVS